MDEIAVPVHPAPRPLSVTGPTWNGAAALLGVTIPNSASVVGIPVYVQGVLLDSTPRIGLGDAVELFIGT